MSENLILLLQIIRADGNLEPLSVRGLEYSQIAELLSKAKHDGYVILSEDKLELSEEGEKVLSNSSKQKIVGGGWIRPLEEYRVDQMDKGEIYLPESTPY